MRRRNAAQRRAGLQRAGVRQRGIDVTVPGRAPLQFRVGGPVHRLEITGTDLGLAALEEVRWHARHAQALVAAQYRQGGIPGDLGIHQHQRQPGAVPLTQCQHLPGQDIEEACARLDLEQRLRTRQAHARPEPAVELDDHEPVQQVTGPSG